LSFTVTNIYDFQTSNLAESECHSPLLGKNKNQSATKDSALATGQDSGKQYDKEIRY
jgi:hypothetical protein